MSIEGTYQAEVDMGMGAKSGIAKVTTDADKVTVELDAPIVGKIQAEGTKVDEDSFTVSGTVKVLFKRIDYTVEGKVEGDTLTAVVNTSEGKMTVVGTRVD